MSHLKSEVLMSNADGYLSDGSWCSDFDDSPESSNNWEPPLSEDYSQEIKDNQINENLEAKLVNAAYVNTQPIHASGISSQIASSASNALPNEIVTENLGAIPKRAFSYLNNELNQNIKNQVIFKGSPRRDEHLEEIKPGSSDKPSQSLNLPNKPSNSKNLASPDKSIKDSKDSQKSNTTTPTQKTPSKLKPEAFSFLNKIIENQSSKETNIKNFKGEYKKHFVPTGFVDEERSKRSHASPKSPENDKYERIVPTAPPLIDFQNNSDHSVDHSSPTQVTNAIPFVKTLQKQDGIKPPLPARPPPISKYPPEMFSKDHPRTLNNAKADHQQLILPTMPLQTSSIKIIPKTAKYSTGIDSNTSIRMEFDEILVPTPGGDNNFRKSSLPIDNSLSNVKPIIMSERPLPPVPISLKSKVTQNNNIQAASEINKIEDLQIKANTANQINPVSSIEISKSFLKQNLVSNSDSEDTVPIPENVNAEDQILKKRTAPDLKPKPRQRIDIIGHQTNVSSETFHSQHKISAAITARLQNLSSMKPIDDSYEKPKNEKAPSDLTEQEGSTRSLELNMESRKAIALSQEENDPISKRHSPIRTFSDLDEIQQSITRPCLPQKLRTTQRSVSCTSLVQTFKDMSFSIWNNNDKDKRRSEGRNSFESQTKNPHKDNAIFEKTRPRGISKVSANDKETIPKVVCSEEKVDLNATTEKQVVSRFAWYHHISAREAQHRLLALGQDGTFLIRPSSTPTDDIQYTTCVVYSGRVLNLHIRKKNGQYALGKEKTGEKTFSSLSDLINYHQEMPIEIRPASRSSTSQELIYVYLRVTPPK